MSYTFFQIAATVSGGQTFAPGDCMASHTALLLAGIVLILFCVFAGMNMDAKKQATSLWFRSGVFISASYLVSILLAGFFIMWVISVASSTAEPSNERQLIKPNSDELRLNR